SGELKVGPLTFPHLQPTAFQAVWKGHHLTFDSVSLKASAANATLHLDAKGNRNLARIENLTLEHNGKTQLRLEDPFRLSIAGSHVALEQFTLSGASGRAKLKGST